MAIAGIIDLTNRIQLLDKHSPAPLVKCTIIDLTRKRFAKDMLKHQDAAEAKKKKKSPYRFNVNGNKRPIVHRSKKKNVEPNIRGCTVCRYVHK